MKFLLGMVSFGQGTNSYEFDNPMLELILFGVGLVLLGFLIDWLWQVGFKKAKEKVGEVLLGFCTMYIICVIVVVFFYPPTAYNFAMTALLDVVLWAIFFALSWFGEKSLRRSE